MTFNLVRISQQDPRWKNTKLGFGGGSTIGAYGCAMTSVTMLLSGFGFPETPDSLNNKLKQNGGYVQDAIVWGAVSSFYPKVRFRNLVICRDTDAPIDAISNSIYAGQPVLLEVDSSPRAGLQTHWVLAYNKVGKDFYILDPWPYPTEEGKDISLMTRYSQGKELKRSITAVVWYECTQSGDAPTAPPQDGSFYVRVKEEAVAGLRIRSAPSTAGDTLSIEYPGTFIKVTEAEAGARAKIGITDQWLQVRNAAGVDGFCAAWFVDAAAGSGTATPSTPPASSADTSPQPQPTTPEPAPVTSTPAIPATPAAPVIIKRARASVADGLESLPTEAPTARRLKAAPNQSGTFRLVADIWNRYGGLLEALSNKLNIEPGVAVGVFAVESGGQAFGPDGRTLIRFENHLFYNYWGKQNVNEFNKYFTFDLGQRWTGHKFRPDPKAAWIDFHGNQAKEWDVLQFACRLDETAAKNSISMGAPQIMGFNYAVIGYASVLDMFTAFARSDRDQVIGFFDFVQGVLPGGGALTPLRRKDFTSFATIYNGSGQAAYYGSLMKNGYEAFNSLYASLPPAPAPQAPSTPDPVTPAPVTPAPVTPNPVTPNPVTPTPVTPDPTTPADSTSQPETPADTATPQPETPDPEPPKMRVVISPVVGKGGLRLRKNADYVSEILAIHPIGTVLRVLEENFADVRRRIGKRNQWIWVRDDKGNRGYVLSEFVIEQTK